MQPQLDADSPALEGASLAILSHKSTDVGWEAGLSSAWCLGWDTGSCLLQERRKWHQQVVDKAEPMGLM